MKKWILVVTVACMMLLGTTSASFATVLTFDQFSTTGDNEIPVPNGYGGLTWDNIWITDGDPNAHGLSGYYYGTTSGSDVAFNGIGLPGAITGSPFDFIGAYLTGAWNNGLNIRVQGYRGGVLEYDRTVVVDSTAPTFFHFDYAEVDKLAFSSFGGTNAGYGNSGNNFVMDDFTFNKLAIIPEPSTIVLLGAGLMTVACLRKATRKS